MPVDQGSGLVVSRPSVFLAPKNGTVGLWLMSDLHIGAANVDYDLIKEELKNAASRRCRILVNGDVLDLILTKDLKRFTPHTLHPRLRGTSDIVGEAIEWAYEILSPYACFIDLIAAGNHEAAVVKYTSNDPLLQLVKKLEKTAKRRNPKHVIHYGGYSGFVDYRFKPASSKTVRYVVYYHHGQGGEAPVTKGIIDLYRKSAWVNADLIWEGHKHTKMSVPVQTMHCPVYGCQPVLKDVYHVRTGAYFQHLIGQDQRSIRASGYPCSWPVEKGFAPSRQGGVAVWLNFSDGRLESVRTEL